MVGSSEVVVDDIILALKLQQKFKCPKKIYCIQKTNPEIDARFVGVCDFTCRSLKFHPLLANIDGERFKIENI
jgi:hypothetical protein